MGSPPPPDSPPPGPPPDPALPGVSVDVGFPPSPTAASICGFAIPPRFKFNISLSIPFPDFSLPLPFNFSLSLVCDLSNPISAEVSFGGGRTPTPSSAFDAESRDY
jgi:hypothetical protein